MLQNLPVLKLEKIVTLLALGQSTKQSAFFLICYALSKHNMKFENSFNLDKEKFVFISPKRKFVEPFNLSLIYDYSKTRMILESFEFQSQFGIKYFFALNSIMKLLNFIRF